ncbi:carbohydrate-binding module family 13 protein [Hypholoma sublateritium FD-334 SS-4]|uniref:Carbohydrate-binding module family 13 protein n=1 Tax=Hypholoma sublateritium (strain FD-334 SS-4) TaxID=945553 RepID=A0A0D2NBP1_HYPSF|nr:carbohydrate-binding module family 13 protein [Hypholoma sublateritium FD-334 SS-4]
MSLKFNITSAILLATISLNSVAGLGIPDNIDDFQIQPLVRGSFPRTPCLTVTSPVNGSALIIQDCTTLESQRGFRVVSGGSTTGAGLPGSILVFNNFCLEVAGGSTASGTKVEANSCDPSNNNQAWQWNSNGTINWAGTNKCLDLTNGNLTNGNQMQIWTCIEGNQNQIWSANGLANPLDEVSLNSNPNLCMAANSSANGSPVFITDCSDASSRKVWSVPQVGHGNSGSYQLSFGTDGAGPIKCLDVTDGQVVPGTKLQLWDCTTGNANQFFTPTTVIRWEITGLVGGLCVDLTDGIQTKGNQLQMWNCTTGDTNQIWNDVEPPQSAT